MELKQKEDVKPICPHCEESRFTSQRLLDGLSPAEPGAET
jgi:hypothetical protein